MDQPILAETVTTETDLPALLRVAWRYKYLVLSITMLAAMISVAMALMAKPVYRAEVVITEVREGPAGSGGSGLASQLGGLASAAGISLGSGSAGNHAGQAVLKSRHLVEEFVKRNNLIPELFRNSKKQPTLWLAVKRFQEGVLRITEDTRQGKTTLSIDWTDPETAARWANGVVALANELVRTRALSEATRNVAYLREQINKTTVVELQRVMYDLIESETKTLMLANERAEYAFMVVDPAVAPELRISPQRTLMVLAGTIIGFCLGIALAFTLDVTGRWRGRVR